MGRKHRLWHEELDKITTSLDRLALDNDDEVRAVVLDRLKRPTDVFLRKTIFCFRSSNQEERLNALIRNHSDKAVALLSCAHVLSRSTVRSILQTPIELSVDLRSHSSVSKFSGLIAAVHLVNEQAVSKEEAKRARTLIRLLEKNPDNFLRHLRAFFSVANPDLLRDLFPHQSLDELLRRLCLAFGAQVEAIRNRCDWAAAHRAVGDLSSAFGISPVLDDLINNSLSYVQAWTRWRPVQRRILGQEKLTAQQKNDLAEVLVLNGTDFMLQWHRTMVDAMLYQAWRQRMNHIRHGRFVVLLSTDAGIDSRTYVEGVLNFPSGSHLSMPGAVATFVFLCLRNTVSLNTLRILEQAGALKEPSVYKSMSDIFYSPSSSIRIDGVMHLLRIVHASGKYDLMDCLNGYIRDIIQEDFKEIQMKLYDLMSDESRRNPQTTASRVQALGQSISNIPSLSSSLDQDSQSLFNDWPSANEVTAFFHLRAEVDSSAVDDGLRALIEQYGLARLTGRGVVDEVSLSAITALLGHWQEKPRIPRRTLALSIMSCTSLSPDVKANCLSQMRDLGDGDLRELDTIICSASEMACTRLAKLICIKRFARHREQGCWNSVLLSLMESKKTILLDNTIESLEVRVWLEWLGHLRKIFDVREDGDSHGHPILEHPIHAWAQVLEERYLGVLSKLESESSVSFLVQGSLRGCGWQTPIRTVLDFFKNERARHPQHPLLQAVGDVLAQGGVMDERVWARLAALV